MPKPLRDALGLAGVHGLSLDGAGLTVVPGGRTARLVEEDGHLVADVDVENGQEAPVTDRRRCASNPADLPPS